MIKFLITAGLFCVGTAVWAQTPPPEVIGKVTKVQGVVTISDGVTVRTAVLGTVITEGNRFVTASSGAARLTMDNGCVINLKPKQSLVINGKGTCRELIALIQPVGGDLGAAAVGEGTGEWGTGLAIGGGVLLAVGLAGGGSSSPATGGGGGGGGGIPVVPISGQ